VSKSCGTYDDIEASWSGIDFWSKTSKVKVTQLEGVSSSYSAIYWHSVDGATIFRRACTSILIRLAILTIYSLNTATLSSFMRSLLLYLVGNRTRCVSRSVWKVPSLIKKIDGLLTRSTCVWLFSAADTSLCSFIEQYSKQAYSWSAAEW